MRRNTVPEEVIRAVWRGMITLGGGAGPGPAPKPPAWRQKLPQPGRRCLRSIRARGAWDRWEAMRAAIYGLTEGDHRVISWEAEDEEHHEHSRAAEHAAYGAALALVAGGALPPPSSRVLLTPLAEALPWLLPGFEPAPVRDLIRQTVGPHIVVLAAVTADAPESDGARAIVRTIRQLAPPSGGQVLVTGQTAYDVDLIAFILQRVPGAIAWVVLMTYLVLFLLVGSVVLPLKAVLMNVVSISASFGALVWIFQQGHLSRLLNFAPSSIDPSVPVLLFCIIFGLSMDYEVLLLSRIQEEYRRTGSTTEAVAEGLERSGRLITGAAAIMVAVFAAFGLADVVLIKSIGLGLAIAVTLDATLVRALIVPAVMRLLGAANWWSPRPLARLHRRLGLGETAALRPRAVA